MMGQGKRGSEMGRRGNDPEARKSARRNYDFNDDRRGRHMGRWQQRDSASPGAPRADRNSVPRDNRSDSNRAYAMPDRDGDSWRGSRSDGGWGRYKQWNQGYNDDPDSDIGGSGVPAPSSKKRAGRDRNGGGGWVRM
jgi:hypothetical protein